MKKKMVIAALIAALAAGSASAASFIIGASDAFCWSGGGQGLAGGYNVPQVNLGIGLKPLDVLVSVGLPITISGDYYNGNGQYVPGAGTQAGVFVAAGVGIRVFNKGKIDFSVPILLRMYAGVPFSMGIEGGVKVRYAITERWGLFATLHAQVFGFELAGKSGNTYHGLNFGIFNGAGLELGFDYKIGSN
jgi:hypothetical protein